MDAPPPVIAITNSKLAGLEPRWALFRGISLLFVNPTDAPLIRALREILSALSADPDSARLGLCTLPPESLHVTAWDGVNDGNLPQVVPAFRGDWARWLDHLHPPDLHHDLLEEILSSELLSCPDWNLSLRCEQLENWGNVSLVARLGPADAPSAESLRRLTRARTDLSNAFDARFGVRPHPDFTPHVTLAYFAHAALAATAASAVDRWNRAGLNLTGGHSLTFHRIAPSVFTDMASFGRGHV